jgi:hypothetical protein
MTINDLGGQRDTVAPATGFGALANWLTIKRITTGRIMLLLQ